MQTGFSVLPTLALLLSASASAAGEIETLMAAARTIEHPAPCLVRKDGCPMTTSERAKATLKAVELARKGALQEIEALEVSIQPELEEKRALVRTFKHEKMIQGSEKRLEAMANGYVLASGVEAFTRAIDAFEAKVVEIESAFQAFESEAARVVDGREAYFRGMREKYTQAFAGLSAAKTALLGFAAAPTQRESLFKTVLVSPIEIFETNCGPQNLQMKGETIDILAEAEFLKTLTREKNLTVQCRTSPDFFLDIGNRWDAQYKEKTNTLILNVGTRDCGNWNSGSCYVWTGFSEAYRELKKGEL